MRTSFIIVLIIMALAGAAVIGSTYLRAPDQGGRACTMEAQICPDGSAVGRTGPNCEFAACPGTDGTADLQYSRLICGDGAIVDTAYDGEGELMLEIGDETYTLTQQVSASGARFANQNESVVFWNKGNVTSIEMGGEVAHDDCMVPTSAGATENTEGLISVASPAPGETILSPLTITGEARGSWYFEATFPVILTDWDGRIIAEHYAAADGDWMTVDFVPFTATLEFENPYEPGDPDFMRRGFLILQKSNASGLPEHDDALEIPVVFNP